jgi:hypothetical protein
MLIVVLEKSQAFGKALYPTKTSVGARGLAPTPHVLSIRLSPQPKHEDKRSKNRKNLSKSFPHENALLPS